MKDVWHSFLKLIDHNRYTALGMVLVVVAISFMIGCTSNVRSLTGDGQSVNRETFEREVIDEDSKLAQEKVRLEAEVAALNVRVAAFNQKTEAAVVSLDRQDEMKAKVLDLFGGAIMSAAEGTINPAGLAVSAVSLLGLIGGITATADNRRKDKKITELANGKTTG